MEIALVTWSGLPALAADDQLLRDALASRGATVAAAVWDDPSVDWCSFDLVTVRSTWDYHKRIGDFTSWLDRLERENVPLWNPAALLRRNTHKEYLADLVSRGVNVVPTVLLRRGADASLSEVLERQGWTHAVIKPAVSATAYRTHRIDASADSEFRELVAEQDVLLQPFVREVVEEGEWSLIFFRGEFSHAVLKRARSGDFRVQNDFGGGWTPAEPTSVMIDEARAMIDAFASDWLYARVDGVMRGGHLMLMELEMTEPSLFLFADVEAPARFAEALWSAAASSRPVRELRNCRPPLFE